MHPLWGLKDGQVGLLCTCCTCGICPWRAVCILVQIWSEAIQCYYFWSELCPVNILSRRTVSGTRGLLSRAPGLFCFPAHQAVLHHHSTEMLCSSLASWKWLCQMEIEDLRNFKQYQVKSTVRWSNRQCSKDNRASCFSQNLKQLLGKVSEFLGKVFWTS